MMNKMTKVSEGENMNKTKILLLWLITCSFLIFKPAQAFSSQVASAWLGTEDILLTINVSSALGTSTEWLIGENVTVDFTFESHQQHWGAEWAYPLKIHRLEVELSGAGISYKKTIASDEVLYRFDDVRHIVEVRPTYNGVVKCVIDISFESNDLAHKGSMDGRQERLTFPLATARLTTYDDLYDDYANSQSNVDAFQNQLNVTRILMYIFIASTVVFIATTVYFAIRKPKVKTT